MSFSKAMKDKAQRLADQARVEAARQVRPYAVFQCPTCNKGKVYDKDWLVPKQMLCVLCGNNISPKIKHPQDYDSKDWR
jgi:uncharacterized protein (DUF983 family)